MLQSPSDGIVGAIKGSHSCKLENRAVGAPLHGADDFTATCPIVTRKTLQHCVDSIWSVVQKLHYQFGQLIVMFHELLEAIV